MKIRKTLTITPYTLHTFVVDFMHQVLCCRDKFGSFELLKSSVSQF